MITGTDRNMELERYLIDVLGWILKPEYDTLSSEEEQYPQHIV